MSVLKLSAATRQDLAIALLARLDGAVGPATVKFYTGTQPETVDTPVSDQVLLGTLTCSKPCATASNGVLTFASIAEDVSADTSGVATWARFADSNGVAVLDAKVTELTGDGIIKLSTTVIVVGGPVRLTAFNLTIGGA